MPEFLHWECMQQLTRLGWGPAAAALGSLPLVREPRENDRGVLSAESEAIGKDVIDARLPWLVLHHVQLIRGSCSNWLIVG